MTAATDAAELLDRIHADPSDLGLRAVYADCLSQAGDLRGELIALQLIERLSKEQARRARQLTRRHGLEWLGELRPLFRPKNLVYRHGFAVAGQLAPRIWEPIRKLRDRGEWSTLEELDLFEEATRQVDPDFLSRCRWHHLRVIRGLRLENFAAIAASPEPWDLETVSLIEAMGPRDDQHFAAAATGAGLPKLKTLNLTKTILDQTLARWFPSTAFWQAARNIHVALTPAFVVNWAPALELICRRNVATLVTIDCYPWKCRLENDVGATVLRVVRARNRGTLGAGADSLGTIVRAFSFRLFDEIHVRLNARASQADAMREQVRTTLRRYEDRLTIG